MKSRITLLVTALLAAAVGSRPGVAAPPPTTLINQDFTSGQDQPEGWRLNAGQGRWIDRQVLEVTGNGRDSNAWQSTCRLEPATLYHFEFRGRRVAGSGMVVSGPASANHDWTDLVDRWQWRGHVFRTRDNLSSDTLRLGQWCAMGTFQFDAVRLCRAMAVHRQVNGLMLGDGESIRDGVYAFHGSFDHQGTNYHRPLASCTASFNTNRWSFGGAAELTYRFAVPGVRMLTARAAAGVNHHTAGGCTLEVSRDQKAWHTLSTVRSVGELAGDVPAGLLPADALFVRVRGNAKDSGFQIARVEFEAKLSAPPADADGRTEFVDLGADSRDVAFRSMHWEPANGRERLAIEVENRSAAPRRIALRAEGIGRAGTVGEQEVGARATTVFHVEPLLRAPGDHRLKFVLAPQDGAAAEARMTLRVPDYYRTDYGQLLSADSSAAVWWCDAVHKIPRGRALPTRVGKAAVMSAARNDHEALQVVIRPTGELRGLTASASALTAPGGATIAAAHVKVLRVYYHFVDHPTDRTGVRDFWPDALPPLDQPVNVDAGQNQPLWILVYVPADARPDSYAGTVRLQAQGWSAEVPLRLRVWNFALPERNHLETAFGMSPGMAFRYHGVKTEADRRRLLDMYFQSFAEHRISTYDLTPLDPIRVKFVPDATPPRAELDFSAFDRELARVRERFHFTNFRLPIQGMGGGTFQSRHEPRIGRFGEDTPQYQTLFASYVRQLEQHLREKGWLEMAYVYWFDEPAPKDFPFVRNGMLRLKKYAPGLTRMLTQEPVDELLGAVNLWCPISDRYDHAMAERRRAEGERFWWYVCCGPKAPYCTLFIDHPATDLRVWLWQTWQRRIVGNLVWESNYWTSGNAYPDQPQNPYEDPMGYVSDGTLGRGVKHYWGNGDGRFLYPPEAAAVPGKSGPGPVIAPPVSSIRWEMLREGIEDYEYLYLLRDLVAKQRATLAPDRLRQLEALLEVPAAITADATTFTTDPAPIFSRRSEIAGAIEALTK
jgi:hypothetical protein